ncbi:MAG TPA: threonine--tRNA ligase [Candidatus Latescibacteria bacterium]|nr:threonine--tRNA ligase [Candidatus Latescibacterota bacterium]HJP30938.1 threonine--tRNA ligase [Candidatus Latescibacterota bacterium]
MRIQIREGEVLEHEGGGNLRDILIEHDKTMLREFIAARSSEESRIDFHTELGADAEVELMAWDDPEAAWIYRHSMSHVLAQAVRHLFPDAQLAIGPAIDDGFYYDFDVEEPFTPEDLKAIEKQMKRVVKQNHRFEREEVSRDEALSRLEGDTYKLELLEDLDAEETLTFYKDGDFVDLCRGPHMLSTGQVKHYKLLNVAGAYWRGDESRKMLQRIYGTAFATREALDHHMKMLEEAKKRDHRRLGQELELFFFDDEVGPGLPLWQPKGTVLIDELEKLAKETETEADYLRVRTPHIAKDSIYLTSGHLPYYKESMFPPMEMEGVTYYLKPMNCPHHHKIFGSEPRSYRDLPIRLTEYGTCYRYEQSGELFGLMRVRSMQMNDAHIYCRIDQFEEEFLAVCRMYLKYFELFGIEKYMMRFSTHSEEGLGKKYVDAPELWKKTEDMVRRTLENGGIPYEEVAGEAAFYGPKIDVEIWSAIGREFSIATNQVDFAVPERFGLHYTTTEGGDETPLCIHRAPLGTHERMIGFLIEHYAGAFPPWLAPVQAVVLPIAERHQEYGAKVLAALRAEGVRAESHADQTLNYRIRAAQKQKIPFMMILGDREVEDGQVAIRLRSGDNMDPMGADAAVTMITDKIATRSAE